MVETDLEIVDDVTWFRLILGLHEAEGIRRHMVILLSSWNSNILEEREILIQDLKICLQNCSNCNN